MGVNLSYGNQRAHSEQKVVQQTHSGSQLTAGRDLRLQATQGDIDIAGSQLKAGRDTTLSAAQDILLHSSQDSETLSGNNSSHGGSLGVGIGASGNSAGISISASVNASKGKENGSSLTHQETTLDSGGQVTLHSGRDTSLTGAQVNGERIVAEVGRNLTLTSEQDSNRYDSKQQSASAGGSFTFGTMTPSGSLNLSKDKMHSTYDSVQEQTGLFAGKGGFDVKVGEHTQLNGAVIGSTASAEHNRLETGTLGFSDIDNQAGYKVEHQSVGASTGGGMANFIGNLANGLAVAGNKEKSDSSTTHAAVSEGTIVINDTAKQQQNVDDLSRDVEHAHQTLSPIFDKEKEQQRMQTLQLIGEVGNQAADIARTQGDIAGFTAAKAKYPTYTDKQLRETVEFKQASQPFGTGSAIQQAITASTAAIQGLAGGDLAKALAGGAAPYLAEEIHKRTTTGDKVNIPANLMAHAVVNAALSLAKGENALAGASSAVTAEAVGLISKAYYDKKPSELDESQKQTISALASLAAGLAGGLVGGDTASAVSGMQTGKVTVENNYLSDKDITTFTEKYAKAKTDAEREQLRSDLKKLDAEQQKQALSTGISVADQKSELAKLKQLAASSDCVGQCRELANYSISQLEPVANNTQLHKDNLTKAVLASTIFALTLDQPAKSGEKTPAAGASSASKPASAIDDIVNGTGGAVGIGNTTAEETAIKNAGKSNINSSLKVGETKVVNNISVTRVGRWMSSDELAQMQSSGKVVQGGGGLTFISTNGVNDFKGAAPKGSVYVEFDVPSSSLIQGGKDGWYKMLGSDAKPSQKYQLDKQGGSLTPDVNNINVLDKK